MFIGRVLGSLFLLFVHFRKLKLTYSVQAVVHTLILLIIFVPIYVEPTEMAKSLLLIGTLASGFCRTFILIIKVLFMNQADPNEDKVCLTSWVMIIRLGDAAGLFLLRILLEAGVKEDHGLIIFTSLLLLASVLQHLAVDEVEQPEAAQQGCDYIRETYQNLKVFFLVTRNWMWLVKATALNIFYYTLLLWTPYYFDEVGLQKYTLVISIMYPLANFLSTMILTYLLSFCDHLTPLVNNLCYLINIGIGVALLALEPREENTLLFMAAIGGMGFCTGFGYSRATIVEMMLLTEGNARLLR